MQLQYVAQMISGGLKSKVYVLNINGFDTHDSQVSSTDPTTGLHADLIKQLSDAIAAFQDDLALLGIEERVAGMTFSEFGRQYASNASFGTDHGDAAPLFMFGTCLEFDIYGPNPVVPDTVVNQAGVPMQIDFRDVYASVLKDWFGVASNEIQALFEHTVTYYPLIGACSVGLEEEELSVEQALIYPNPCSLSSTVRFTAQNEWVKVDVYDLNQRKVVEVYDGNLSQGRHDIKMDIGHLTAGNYLVVIKKESGTVHAKLIKGR